MSHPDRDSIAQLLKLAGERDMPTELGTQRARRAAQAAWRGMLGSGARPAARPLGGWLLGAACAGLVAAWLLWPRTPEDQPLLVARVAAVVGDATLQGVEPRALLSSTEIHSGSTLETADGHVAVLFGDSLSLRVDRDTRVRFEGAGQVSLLGGSLYVDSGGVNVVSTLLIKTPAGEVRHVGTQFQVTVDGASTRVQVREGRVLLRRARAELDIAAGDLLEVDRGGVSLRRGMPSYGEAWEWVTLAAPAFDIENRPMSEFLAWLCREQGWQARFADEALQERTRDIRLHGSIAGLGTAATLERVSLITGVPLVANDGVLWVGEARR
jgi:ferric-dicitrate binding protein FerR (iron transport regulator)